jgi:hypothetical protein
MRKLIAAAALAATLLAFTSLPVHADTPGGTSANVAAWTGPGNITAYAGGLYRFPGGHGGNDFGGGGGGDGLMAGCPGESVSQGADGTLTRHDGSNLVPSWHMNDVPLKPGNIWVECAGIGASVTACCATFVFQIPLASLTPVLPIDLARELQKTQNLPSPVIETNPAAAKGLVNFPTWLWIAPGAWNPQVAGPAVVAGVEQITVTATPASVTWNLPDAAPSTVVCNGPGTAYSAAYPARSPSPDCGTQFASATAGTTVSATISWPTGYVATGLINETGTLPTQTTTATVGATVEQDQTVNAAK